VCFAGTVAIGVGNRANQATNLRHSAIRHGLWFYVRSMRRLPVGVLLLLVAAASGCKTDETIAVHSVTINGTHAVNPSQLRTALATRENPKLPLLNVRLPWTKQRNFFDRNRFDADLKRIEAYYADRGYPDARVTSFDVKLNDKHNAVDVSITVNEGEPVRIVSVAFQGFDMIPPSHFESLQKDVPLHVGDPRDRQAVLAARDLALNELRDHGYPYSRVTSEENDGPDGKQASITLVAEPGPVANFGPIEITGNASVSDEVIRRQLLYKPGELYRRSSLQETQRRLYGMSLFQFVNVEAVNTEAQDAEVKTKVTVVEGRHQRVNLGVGYGTEENARVDAEYHHVNFLGGARSAGVHGRYSSLDRGLRLDFNQPYFFRPTFNLGAEGQRWYNYTPAYKSVISGGKISLTQVVSSRSSWTVSMSSARTSTSILIPIEDQPLLYVDLIALGLDPTTLSQEGTLSAFGFDWQRATTDNALNARNGYQIAVHAEQAGKFLPGTFNYSSISADGRYFLPLGKRLVAANRLLLGNIRPFGYDPANVPFSKKFFLGGATTLRGWGRYEVSPLSGTGLPIGGDTMLSFSTEMRAALKGKLGGVMFLDAGNVWTDFRAIDLGTIRYAVGTGLRYQTPVGPIRLDFGYQLNPIPGLEVNGQPQIRPWRVHFSIGQAF
jgi:outer membrane protein assembly complex protein YaeT